MDALLSAIASQAGIAILVLMAVVVGLLAVLRAGVEQYGKQSERYAAALDKVSDTLSALRVTVAERRQ